MKRSFLVFAGAGLGGVARWAAGLLVGSLLPGPFPWATFTVNVTGCLAMGGLLRIVQGRGGPAFGPRLFLMVGFLGGYTTFSSFGGEVDALLRQGHPGLGILYAAACVFSGPAAVWAGRAVVQRLERPAPLKEELSE
ncbi:MAG TPA: CrcB family protein [Planctomycetota bacterium]|jgi:CrcB protein|nr:CrcB family protein [Planctomycetota bacterium]